MIKLRVKIKSTAPLLMHSSVMVDKTDDRVREIKALNAKKTKKTDADDERISRLEWEAGMYLTDDLRPCLPPECLEAMIRDGARKSRKGKDVQAGAWVEAPAVLDYKGPKDLDALYADSRFVSRLAVVVQSSRIIRTRPQFPEWGATFEILYDDSVLNERDLLAFIETAGRLCGIGDFRPRYGRFEIVGGS